MTIELRSGDCRDVLATLPADSVQCCVTSPPYYGLRDYGCAGQIGVEVTPDEYLATMVAVFREVWRVLRPDGTCWVNMGDSYNTYPGNRGASKSLSAATNGAIPSAPKGYGLATTTLANKQLLMMPARLALALQADGWWLRSDIIWHKPNPMPESCRDRPTSAHEHVFLLTKSARYFYDADAVREPNTEGTHSRGGDKTNGRDPLIKSGHWNTLPPTENPAGRKLRNVWTIATAPYSEAHFATFPPALAERCIKAGTSERGCCGQCGKPWVRVTETHYTPGGPKHSGNAKALRYIRDGEREDSGYKTRHDTTTGWRAGCDHNADVVPCVVLDCFAGAGTTLLCADRLQRDAIGIELNTAYTEMAMQRCRDDAPLFADVPPAADPEDERMADLFADVPA